MSQIQPSDNVSQAQLSDAESSSSDDDHDDDVIILSDTYGHPRYPTDDAPRPEVPEVTNPRQLYLLFMDKMWNDFADEKYDVANEKAMWLLCQDSVPHVARAATHVILSNAPNTAEIQLEHAKYAVHLYKHFEPHIEKEGNGRDFINWALSEAQENLKETEERYKKVVEENEADDSSSEDDEAFNQVQDQDDASVLPTQQSDSCQDSQSIVLTRRDGSQELV